MSNMRFKPKIDKMFYLIWIPTAVMMLIGTLFSIYAPIALAILIPTDILVAYFFLTSLFGYVELREDTVFVKLGFIMTREIPYSKIRGLTKERKFYSDSIVALKNSLEHVNIKYNSFDMISVSVVDNDGLIKAIEERLAH